MNLELIDNDEVENNRKYSRKELIEKLQQWTNENGRIPKVDDFKNNPFPGYPSFTPYANEFGTWNNALDCARIIVRQKKKKYSREQLIKIMQEWIKENGGIPIRDDFNSPSHKTYEREFGSWTCAIKIITGFESNDNSTRSRNAEIQTLSEFKTEGAVDLSGQNRNNICDGVCPKGELYDTKSASLTKLHGHCGWAFSISISQLVDAEYLFLRAYKDKDFTKEPEHRWRVPIKFVDNRRSIFIHKDNRGMYNVDNMNEYEIGHNI